MSETGDLSEGWPQVGAAIAAEGLNADKMGDMQLATWVLDIKYLIEQCEQALANAADTMISAGRRGTFATPDGGEMTINNSKRAKIIHRHDNLWAIIPMIVEEEHAKDRDRRIDEVYEQIVTDIYPTSASARLSKTGLRKYGIDPKHVIDGEGYTPCDPFINVKSAGTVNFLRQQAAMRENQQRQEAQQ